jgi:hypothetical protein
VGGDVSGDAIEGASDTLKREAHEIDGDIVGGDLDTTFGGDAGNVSG